MPAALTWLATRCAGLAGAAAERERRVRFVADRAPIWRHVWAWMHGYVGPNPLEAAGAAGARHA